ncbi:uncharacterized protein LOC143186701 [Calliopsis andreniformis]|uniref:uncharacterized protein LOC143186701 n=1 Tax=Calliopsis andreniformis TaxID=337506 RepID=UPI003FCD8DDC
MCKTCKSDSNTRIGYDICLLFRLSEAIRSDPKCRIHVHTARIVVSPTSLWTELGDLYSRITFTWRTISTCGEISNSVCAYIRVTSQNRVEFDSSFNIEKELCPPTL